MGRILIVDDEKSIRITSKAFLEADGHTVKTAEDATAALNILTSDDVDVLLTDIIMPKVSGVELLKQTHERSPDTQVIIMTGEPTLETAFESLRLGAVDYLQKPIGKTELIKAVLNALHVKRLNDEKKHLESENRNYTNHLEQLVKERTDALEDSESKLRRRADELLILNRLSRKVNESISMEDAIGFGLREMVAATAADMAVLFLRTETGMEIKGYYSENDGIQEKPDASFFYSDCACRKAVEQRSPIFIADVSSDSQCSEEPCHSNGFRSIALLPLVWDSGTIGLLRLASVKKTDFAADASFLESLAAELSIGLKKCILYEQVQNHAEELQTNLTRIRESEAARIKLEEHLQRAQRMEAVGVLASGIAHDFNNILGAVVGYTELAMMQIDDTEKCREYLEMVFTAGQRATDLVKHILAFGNQNMEGRKPTQVTHIVKEVGKFIRASIPTTIEIRHEIAPDVPNIEGNPVEIHQVLMNLCTNAHHAMAEKGGVLRIAVKPVDSTREYTPDGTNLPPGSYVRITVEDTGQGMDEEVKKKIFDPYYTTKPKDLGTGLGLAVVHSIIQRHDGCITVESVVGKGSKFHLYFPAIANEANSMKHHTVDIPTGTENVLFVDDEQFLVDIGEDMLVQLGYHVETKTSSIEALSLFRSHPDRFDIVISDITMPHIAGDEFAVEIKRIRKDIPIILCSGYSESLSEEKASEIGISTVIQKPFLMADIGKAIREALAT